MLDTSIEELVLAAVDNDYTGLQALFDVVKSAHTAASLVGKRGIAADWTLINKRAYY